MSEKRPRVAAVMLGEFRSQPAQVKYGLLFKALARRCALAEVFDASLRGPARWWNAAQTFSPDRLVWRARFYKNVPAFRARSRRVSAQIKTLRDPIDLVFQLGVTFDAAWDAAPRPTVIYTDYTARLSAQKPQGGRSPLSGGELDEWLRLETRAYQRAAHIFTWSEIARRSLLADYHIAPEKVTTVGGGVNLEPLPAPEQPSAARPPVLLFIGKEFYRKGGDLLLRAFAAVRIQYPAARLLLVTQGPIPPGLPLDGVEVITPTWERARIEALYRQASLFVLPSRLETWGDVLLEAMAFALPCIGVSGDAMEEIIEDGKTGLIVPPEQVEPLADAIIRLLGDNALRQTMGLAARQRVEAHDTWDQVVERMQPGFQAVLQHFS